MDVKCMYCRIEDLGAELSQEHTIPEVLGGVFTIPVVCKEHNNRLGHSLESELKKNACIATALDRLGLQPPNLAYREAKTIIDLECEKGLRGYVNENGTAKFFPQKAKQGHLVVPLEQAVDVLKKQVERFEKRTGKKIDFDFGNFRNLPSDTPIPLSGINVVLVKRKGNPVK